MARHCRKTNPSEPEYEIGDLHNSAGNGIFTNLEISCSAFSELSQKVDVIGGKFCAQPSVFEILKSQITKLRQLQNQQLAGTQSLDLLKVLLCCCASLSFFSHLAACHVYRT